MICYYCSGCGGGGGGLGGGGGGGGCSGFVDGVRLNFTLSFSISKL